jgi:drug/metabolite transporter (DMT)-like permease
MILLDIIAPILIMLGLLRVNASTASLLNNFEIVFTALIAMFFFKEIIGKKMWLSIGFIALSGIILSFEDFSGFQVSFGALLVLAASLSWGLENNCTRVLSKGNPIDVVVLMGLGSGLGALIIALILNVGTGTWYHMIFGLLLGFFSFGISLYFYISAQRELGASRTSAYYATAPFIGVIFSFIILKEELTLIFIVAFFIMIFGTYLTIRENSKEQIEITK